MTNITPAQALGDYAWGFRWQIPKFAPAIGTDKSGPLPALPIDIHERTHSLKAVQTFGRLSV